VVMWCSVRAEGTLIVACSTSCVCIRGYSITQHTTRCLWSLVLEVCFLCMLLPLQLQAVVT
jgi:hypothetical protein